MPSDKQIRELERLARSGRPGADDRYRAALEQAGRRVDYTARAMEIMDALERSQGGDHPYTFAENMEFFSQREWRQDLTYDPGGTLGRRFLVIEFGVCRSSDEIWAHSYDTLEQALEHIHQSFYGEFNFVGPDHGMFPWYPYALVDLLLMEPLDLRTCYEAARPWGTAGRYCGPWLLHETRGHWESGRRMNPSDPTVRDLERRVRQGEYHLWPQLTLAKERAGLMPGRSWLRAQPDAIWNVTEGEGTHVRLPGGSRQQDALDAFRRPNAELRIDLWGGPRGDSYVVGVPEEQALISTDRGGTHGGVYVFLFDSPEQGAAWERRYVYPIPQTGDRIEVVQIHNDPQPLEPGTKGVVRRATTHETYGDPWDQLEVDWEVPRSLMLITPPDRVRILWKALS